MEDHMKALALWAGIGAALGIGVAVGIGLRGLATGAALGVGAGLGLGVASGLKSRRQAAHHHAIRAEERPAIH